jgi:tRNA threonylcarbamoyladenosine modification (KEOPS) complex Cgi121 subunit
VLKFVDQFGKYVEIAGFKDVDANAAGVLKAARTKENSKADIQFFDAKLIATWEHLYFAALNALTAFRNGYNISKSLAMETLLYASAQHQIRKAMQLVGIKPLSSKIAVLIIGEHAETVKITLELVQKKLKGKRDDKILELTQAKVKNMIEAFEISATELHVTMKRGLQAKALTELIIERMALLATHR